MFIDPRAMIFALLSRLSFEICNNFSPRIVDYTPSGTQTGMQKQEYKKNGPCTLNINCYTESISTPYHL